MTKYLVTKIENDREMHCEVVEADSAEAACEWYRAGLTPAELLRYTVDATLYDDDTE